MHSAADYGSWFSPKMHSSFCSWVCLRSDRILTTNKPLQGSFERVPTSNRPKHWYWCIFLSLKVFFRKHLVLRLLSHLPHLVRLNRTRVSFPSWCGAFVQVRMQQSHSGAHQKRNNQAFRDLLENELVRFKRTKWGRCESTLRTRCFLKNTFKERKIHQYQCSRSLQVNRLNFYFFIIQYN